MSDRLRDELVVDVVDGTFTLASRMADATPKMSSKKRAKEALIELREELRQLHDLIFANEQRSTLLVLQGTDASGKNGTIKKVVSAMNPAGVAVASFDEPTPDEEAHHFLWRIEQEVPEPGQLAVFNRSHYEDVLVPSAEGTLDAAAIEQRISDILEFEAGLREEDVSVVKCMLHLSYDEQRERFLRRLRRDDKRWKFNESDLDTRRLWDAYQQACGEVIARTSTEESPWYVVPADHKWYRNWAVASLLAETWRDWNLEYPQPKLDLAALREALEPPQ